MLGRSAEVGLGQTDLQSEQVGLRQTDLQSEEVGLRQADVQLEQVGLRQTDLQSKFALDPQIESENILRKKLALL